MPNVFVDWVASLNAIFSSGVQSFTVHIAADDGHYALGSVRDAKVTIKSLNKPDSILIPRGWGFRVEAVLPSLQASATEIKKLNELLENQMLSVRIGFSNGLYLATDKLALHWKIVSGGDFDDERMIEYTFAGNFKDTEVAGLIVDGSGFVTLDPDAGDILFALSDENKPANIVGNGLDSGGFEFKATADDAYVHFDFQKGIFSFETIGEPGGGGRGLFRTNAIKVECSAEGFESDLDKIGLLSAFHDNPLSMKLTCMSGDVITLTDADISIVPEFDSSGNIDKTQRIKLIASGSIRKDPTGVFATWDSIWS